MSNLKPLLLHAHNGGPNPVKVAIVLETLQIPYEVKIWDFGDDPTKGVKGKTFTAINENGRVPALEDPNTGVTSWESGACVNYLRRVYDKGNKTGPRGDKEQDTVDFEKWEYFLLTTLGPMQGQVNWFKHYNASKNDDAHERYVAQTYRCYGVLEGQLKKSDGASIIPGGYTAVDAHFLPWVGGYQFSGLSLDEYPLIAKWLKAFSETAEVKAAWSKIRSGEHA